MKTNNNTLKNIIVITGESEKERKSDLNKNTMADFVADDFGIQNKDLGYTRELIVNFCKTLKDVKLSQIGSGRKGLPYQEIINELKLLAPVVKESHNSSTLIMINTHGGMIEFGEKTHCLVPDITRNDKVLTVGMMKLINKTFEKPVDVILVSCHAGAATDYVHFLPRGSKLITLRSDHGEINSSCINMIAKYLAQNQPTEISTLDILKAYFISGACNGTDAYPSINISGYKKESDFATYLSKRTEKYAEEILEKKEKVAYHVLDILYSEALENEINQLGSTEAKYKYIVNNFIEQLQSITKICASTLKHIQNTIKEINNFDDQIQRAGQQELSLEGIADLFSDYWFSNNKNVARSKYIALKDTIITLVDQFVYHNKIASDSRDTIIADYYKCMVNPDEIPELMGDS
jgi:hypothetical protein